MSGEENKRKLKIEQLAEELFGEMRNTTPEEQEILNEAIKKKSIATGVNIWDFWERPQGEWKLQYGPVGDKRSNIGYYFTYYYTCSECGWAGDKYDAFCNHCGAKMKEKHSLR